jgi:AraC-like DNA-binding protein
VRTQLLDLPVGLVEDLRRADAHPARTPEAFSPDYQVCLPYRGLFVWHVGRDEVVADANQVLWVTGGESYRLSSPLPIGYAELIITPNLDVLAELRLAARSTDLVRLRSWRASPQVQSLCVRFLQWAQHATADDLAAEEAVVALLQAALRDCVPNHTAVGPATRGLIRRAKEVLEAELARPLSLRDVGEAVGASPAYLTHVFHRVEGIPLHRYRTQLRLARALAELPHAGDLTALALDLGFSSHSHFAAVFRRAFGLTPSRFREATRGGQPPWLRGPVRQGRSTGGATGDSAR